MTPQGTATAVNAMIFATATKLNDLTSLEVSLYPGYSNTELLFSILQVNDLFYVRTNGNHYAALLVTAETGSSITLMFRTFGVSGGSGGAPGPPSITSIQNNSSGIAAGRPNYGIAPSSIFVVMGTGLADPGTPVLQNSAQAGGLPLSLNGASISVTVNGVTTHPGIYYTSPTQIAAVLPASTPTGTGTLILSYKGVASNAATILVVPAALGINTFYTNSAVATDAVTGALLTYTNSGTPGEIITLWTTGLGADPADSDTAFTSTPHAVKTPLQIYVAGTLATILYQGSAGYPGVDQINVTIPVSIPSGCWTGVAAVAGGVLSNITTIPIIEQRRRVRRPGERSHRQPTHTVGFADACGPDSSRYRRYAKQCPHQHRRRGVCGIYRPLRAWQPRLARRMHCGPNCSGQHWSRRRPRPRHHYADRPQWAFAYAAHTIGNQGRV